MAEQAGQLLVVRKRLTLEPGITPVDTGLTQVNLGVGNDPPLDGSDPTVDAAGTPSRVQVTPLAPLAPWYNADIYHSEPYVDAGTVWVDFFVGGDDDVEVNVEFWDPHTEVGPMVCNGYTVITCNQSNRISLFGSGPSGSADEVTITNPGAASTGGELLVAVIAVRTTDNFADPASAPTPSEAGWTELRVAEIDMGGGDGIRVGWWYRLTTAAEAANYTWAWDGGADNGGSGTILYIGPVDPVTPIAADAAPVIVDVATNPLSIDAPSVTATQDLSMLVCFWVASIPYAPFFVLPVSLQATQATVRNDAPLPGLQQTLANEAVSAGATGVRNGELAAEAVGLAYSLVVNPACGIFPGGENPPGPA